jgi:hypothetical protein
MRSILHQSQLWTNTFSIRQVFDVASVQLHMHRTTGPLVQEHFLGSQKIFPQLQERKKDNHIIITDKRRNSEGKF